MFLSNIKKIFTVYIPMDSQGYPDSKMASFSEIGQFLADLWHIEYCQLSSLYSRLGEPSLTRVWKKYGFFHQRWGGTSLS